MDSKTKSKFIEMTSEQLDRMDWLITTYLNMQEQKVMQ